MKFSIVIPLYNKENYILDTINSVLNQIYTDYEVIIVDDSSTDRSYSIVSAIKDDRIKVYKKTNGGVSIARNYGIERSSGDFICFLDADDIWTPEYLLTISNYINKYPEVSFFCTGFKKFRNDPNNVIAEIVAKFDSEILDYFKASILYKGPIALTSAVVVRRELLLSLDYIFAKDISMGEDLDLWTRVALRSRVCYINLPLMLYRSFADGSLTSNKSLLLKSFPFWKWYSYSDNNKHLKKFTTIIIYTLAINLLKNKQYSDSYDCLSMIRGADWSLFRLKLLIQLLLKRGI